MNDSTADGRSPLGLSFGQTVAGAGFTAPSTSSGSPSRPKNGGSGAPTGPHRIVGGT
jgi:hypothetical protein